MDIENIITQFAVEGRLLSCEAIGNGNINSTYCAAFDNSGVTERYVLQRVNDKVFHDIPGLMDNVVAVTQHLSRKLRDYGLDDKRGTLHFIPVKDGGFFYCCESGYWRLSRFVENTVAYDNTDSCELLKKCAGAFGLFGKMLSDFPVQKLNVTIADFHDTEKYYREFLQAVSDNAHGRLSQCEEEVSKLRGLYSYCSEILAHIGALGLPVRVTHNDTKLNNALFDKDSGECVCIIDLDTVMPGYSGCDFGDAVRSGANTAGESEKDLSKVSFSAQRFSAYVCGYLSQAGGILTDDEIDSLPLFAFIMTFECAVRFITDFLHGDRYFTVKYPLHNLDRGRVQTALAYDIKDKLPQLNEIVQKYREKFCRTAESGGKSS